jgi:hypothetical protein
MNVEKFDLQAMGLTELTEQEMLDIDGGSIFGSIWNGIKAVGEAIADAAEAVAEAVADAAEAVWKWCIEHGHTSDGRPGGAVPLG